MPAPPRTPVVRRAVVLSLVLGGLLLGGCSGTDESEGPSQVDREAEVESAREWMVRMAECLTEAGFPSTIEAADEMTVDHGPEQMDELDEATQRCAEQLGGFPQYEPFSAEELGRLYDAKLEQEVACLEENGFEPPTPPSRGKYISDYQAYQSGQHVIPWSPFVDLGPDASSRASELCPQVGVHDL